MNMASDQVSSLHPFSHPILLVENHPVMLESLPRALNRSFSGLVFDVCSSPDHALQKLTATPYQAIVSSVQLAEVGNFSLLRQNRSRHPLVPFIITAGAREKWQARQAVTEGAFDIILNPLKPPQAERTIRLALLLYQLRITMSHRERRLEQFRQQWAAFSAHTRSSGKAKRMEEIINDMEQTLLCYGRTIPQLEKSFEIINKVSGDLESQARHGAEARLDDLFSSDPPGSAIL